MGRCAFCYNATSFFNSKKIVNGTICNSCLKSIPNCFNIDRYDADELQKVQRYESNPKFNDFTVTCELGSLLLDEMHGLFAISSKQNVFSLTDLGEFDIHPARVERKNNKLYLDIEFMSYIKPIDVHITKTIKSTILCEGKLNGEEVEYPIPPEVSLFKDIFSQAIKKQFNDILPLLTSYQNISNQAKLIAESMLLVGDNYTLPEIKSQRNKLMNIYHPDNGGDAAYCERINASYKYLVDHYKPPKSVGETAIDETIQI